MYVQRHSQRIGIGAALLASAEAHAKGCGAPFLWLTAWLGNTNARAFYLARGYEDVGAASHAFEGRAYENRIYRKAFDASAQRPLPTAMAPMQLTMYEASVPVFTRYLGRLAGMLSLAEAFAIEHRADPRSILQAQLSPTMYPFAVQVEIAANFAVRACAPLAGLPLPTFGEHRESFAALNAHVARTVGFLGKLTPGQMEGSEGRRFESQAGHGSVSLEGPVFLLQYALPNFLFHVTTAYAILRHLGVDLGKADYDGFHVYAQRG